MAETERCPDCGAPLGAGAAPGPCPACLLKLGLDSGPDKRATVRRAAKTRPRSQAAAGSTPAGVSDAAQRIGPYRLVRVLGEGGFGIVYLAEQEAPLRRDVAIKVIKLGMDSREIIARFEAEQHALALMSHPNIARVLDAGTTERGTPYFVMEHVPGLPITDYCDRHRLSSRDRLALFVEVCHAVQHAHQKGIIHRDIKPSNVLVAVQDGRAVPKVIDFGISKALDQRRAERSLFTERGVIIGTPAYMSPEQADIAGIDIDTTTDVYSLGVLLYELLAGAPPFDAARLCAVAYDEMLRILREEDPPPLPARIQRSGPSADEVARRRRVDSGALTRQLTGDLDWITRRALDKDRTRRYASASELAADVERYLSDEPVVARPPSAAYRIRKFARKHRGPLLASSIAGLGLIAGLIASLVLWRSAEAAATEADEQRQVAEEVRLEAERSRDVAQSLALASASRTERDAGHAVAAARLARAAVRLHADPATTQTLRDALAAMHDHAKLVGHSDDVVGVDFSPDSQLAVTASIDKTARLWGRNGEPLAVLAGHAARVNWARFAAGGQRVVTGSDDNTVRVWDLAGTQVALLEGHAGPVLAGAVAADGQLIATAGFDRTARLWDVSGRSLAVMRGHAGSVRSVVFSAKGDRILTASLDGTARLWDVAGRQVLMVRHPEGPLGGAAISPDGAHIVTESYSSVARLWSSGGHELLTLDDGLRVSRSADGPEDPHLWDLAGGSFSGRPHPAFDPSGQAFTTLVGAFGPRVCTDEDFSLTLRVPRAGRAVVWAGFSPAYGGRFFTVAESGEIGAWIIRYPEVDQLFSVHSDGGLLDAALSPDGQVLASVGERGHAALWLTTAGERQGSLLPLSGGAEVAAVDADGRRFLVRSEGAARIFDETGRLLLGAPLELSGSPAVSAWIGSRALRAIPLPVGDAARLGDSAERAARVAVGPDGQVSALADSPDALHVAVIVKMARRPGTPAGDSEPQAAVVILDQAGQVASTWIPGPAEPPAPVPAASLPSRSRAINSRRPVDLAWAPDGQRIAVALSDGTARVVDMAGRELRVLRGDDTPLSRVAWSPDGRTIASAGTGGVIRDWDAEGKPIAVMRGHAQDIRTLRFAPDGASLVTASADGTTRLWSVEGEQLARWNCEQGECLVAAFCDDGRRVRMIDESGTISTFSVQASDLLASADERLKRFSDFTPDELTTYGQLLGVQRHGGFLVSVSHVERRGSLPLEMPSPGFPFGKDPIQATLTPGPEETFLIVHLRAVPGSGDAQPVECGRAAIVDTQGRRKDSMHLRVRLEPGKESQEVWFALPQDAEPTWFSLAEMRWQLPRREAARETAP